MVSDPKNRRWWFVATGILVASILIWVIAALQLDPAAAGGSRISLSLRSRLMADYRGEEPGQLGSLRLSIVSEILRDLGLGRNEAGDGSTAMSVAMLTPVPTATALNFQGDPPPTVTPSDTPVPTKTDTPEPTATDTPRPRPTSTEEEEDDAKKTPKPAATSTPSGPSDTQKPQVLGITINIPDGSTISCTESLVVTNYHVRDPDYSSGITAAGGGFVKVKYEIDGSSYVYTPMTMLSGGGFIGPGQTWDATYSGTVNIDHDLVFGSSFGGGKALARPHLVGLRNGSTDTPTPTATHTLTPTSTHTPSPTATPTHTSTAIPSPTPTLSAHTVHVHTYIRDNSGNISHQPLATYTMMCH